MSKEFILGLIIILLVGGGVTFLILTPGNTEMTMANKILPNKGESYKEIVNPAGFVNTNDKPIKIGDYVGKKVILLDVMTYSCINCQRTFPYVVAWYERYKDDGFIAIGIHTPEFAFEKDKKNVEEAMRKFGINFPVVLDNDYGTWNAYGNQYWPRKYLIDIHGNVVYDHIGEGNYDETEMKIKELLKERQQVLDEKGNGMDDSLAAEDIVEVKPQAASPETYFGSARNEYFANGAVGKEGAQNLKEPESIEGNALYLDGSWNIFPEYAQNQEPAKILYKYNAKDVYLVADASSETVVEVWQDGKLIKDAAGEDVDTNGVLRVKQSRLYKVVHNMEPGEHTLELRIKSAGLKAYTFTFG